MLFFSGGNFFAQLIMMLYAILIARFLGPKMLGIYSGVYAVLTVTITLVNLGQDNWLLREAAIANDRLSKLLNVIINKILLGLLWTVLCTSLLPLIWPGYQVRFFVLFASIDLLADSLLNSIITSLTIEKKVKHTNTLLLISRAGKLLSLLFMILFFYNNLTLIAFNRMLIAVSVCVYAIKRMYLDKKMDILTLRLNKTVLKEARFFAASDVLAIIYGNVDVAILSLFSLTQAGWYAPASGIIRALFVIPNSFYNYILPIVTNRLSLGEWRTKIDLPKLLALFFVVGVILTLGTLAFSSVFLIPFLGTSYNETKSLLMTLSPILIFKSLSFGLVAYMVACSLQEKRLIPQFLTAILNVITVIFSIRLWGAAGVTLAYLISELFLLSGYLIIVIMHVRESDN